LEKDPHDKRARFYLVSSYLDDGKLPAARAVLERIRRDITGADGRIRDEGYAAQLADGFERLGRPRQALEILESTDGAGRRARTHWIVPRLMRLYAKTDQFAKSLEMCALRLQKEPDDYRAVETARKIAAFSVTCTNGPKLLDAFLKDLEAKPPGRRHGRFVAAVRAWRLAHPVRKVDDVGDLPPDENPVVLLKRGRKVRVPTDARSLTDFLDRLAAQANAVVIGSFRGSGGRLPAPKMKETEGPAFELLAKALNARPVGFEFSPEGHWVVSEHGDKEKKLNFGASGGVLCRFWGANRRLNGPVWALGHIMFEPTVARHVVAVRSPMKVVEAVDEFARKMPVLEMKSRWQSATQVRFLIHEKDALAKKLAKVRVEASVAVCTRWAVLKTPRLDHTEPIRLEKEDLTIEVEPIRTIKRGDRDMWEVPVHIRRKPGRAVLALSALNRKIYFVTAEGKTVRSSGSSSGGTSADHRLIRLRLPLKAFDPATTSLVVREPAAIEIVPVSFTFHDVRIVER